MKVLNLVEGCRTDIEFEVNKFPDGQRNVVIYDSPFNLDFLNHGVNNKVLIKSRLNNWGDLELVACAVRSLRGLGVKEIHLYVPYILGSRSDRKFEEGGNNYLKDVLSPVINGLGLESVMCMDGHSDVLEACLNGFRGENNFRLVWWALKDIYGIGDVGPFTDDRFVLLSPDGGALKKVYKVAEEIGYDGEVICCSKSRDDRGKLSKVKVPLDFATEKDFIILDDICDGGGTFVNIAKEIRGLGYGNRIYLVVTHGIFSRGFEEVGKCFDGIYCTNSYRDIEGIKLIKQMNVYE